MKTKKQDDEKFDLICSLGGNCAAAHNLRYRNLRKCAFPFDWTYFTSEKSVYAIAEGFKTGFKEFVNIKNLKELPVNPSHPDKIQYEDTLNGIIWANHFLYDNDREIEYKRVKNILDRRFKRLINFVEESNNTLFLFCTSFSIQRDSFEYLLKTLQELYPDKTFIIKVISFNCNEDGCEKGKHIEIYRYQRDLNDYDFLKTNYEWNFLDKIDSTQKIRQRISFKLFGYKFEFKWRK